MTRLIGLALAVLLASGCGIHLRPRGGGAPTLVMPATRISGPIDVRAGTADAPGRTVEVSPFDIELRYQEFTDVAAAQLVRELSARGTAVADDADRRIELTVMYVDILRTAGSFTCVVDYRVVLGDGSVRGLQARESSWSYEESCQLAVANVAAATMRDETVARYAAE